MKMKLIDCCALPVLFAASICRAAGFAQGPRDNPDDQIRLYWNAAMDAVSNHVAMGNNVLMTGDSSVYSYERHAVARPDFMTRCLAKVRGTDVGVVNYLKVAALGFLGAAYPLVNRDGTKDVRVPDLSDARCFDELTAAAAAVLDATPLDDPHLVGVQPSSEVRDRSHPSFSPAFLARYRARSGKDVPSAAGGRFAPDWRDLADLPAGRVIPDDWPLYDFYTWFWREGDRWNEYQTWVAREVRRRTKGRVWTYYDPVLRVPPVWGSGGEVTFINHWTYCQPEPFRVGYAVSEENAMARGCPGQGVMAMIQDISYRATIAPRKLPAGETAPAWYRERPDTRFLTCPHDMMREAIWSACSRRLDGVNHYGLGAILKRADGTPYHKQYFVSDPETLDVIADMAHRIGIPLGPYLRAAPERPPRVAVLESAPSALFAARCTWGWQGAVFDAGLVATKASLMPDVLYTEQIVRDGIPASVDVLLLPACEVLLASELKAIKAFQARGGFVLADKWCVPDILPDGDIPAFVRTKKADADARALAAAADQLLKLVSARRLPTVVTSSRDLIAHVRSAGSADLLFVYNDRRTRGEYVGQWNAVLEKGLPASGQVSLARAAGAVYDLERHRRVDFTLRKGRTVLSLDLPPADGVVLLAVEKPLSELTVAVRGSVVEVRSPDRDVLLPIEVRVPGRPPFYGVVRDGAWQHDFDRPADGTTVLNLANGELK